MARPWMRLRKRAAGTGEVSTTGEEPTIRLARKRFARRQRARRWLAWRRVLAAVLGLAVLGGSGWLVFFSSVLAVADVSVEGQRVLGPAEVRRVAAVPIGEPLATVDLDSISARVETLAPVESVDVSRAWPSGIRIALHERDAVAVVEGGDTYRGLDDEGVAFRSYPSPPGHLPVLRVGAETGADALVEATGVVGALPDGLSGRVDFVDVQSIDTISLRLNGGRTVFWGSADDSANKAKVAEVLLRQKATTYDVSVPGQPTIRP